MILVPICAIVLSLHLAPGIDHLVSRNAKKFMYLKTSLGLFISNINLLGGTSRTYNQIKRGILAITCINHALGVKDNVIVVEVAGTHSQVFGNDAFETCSLQVIDREIDNVLTQGHQFCVRQRLAILTGTAGNRTDAIAILTETPSLIRVGLTEFTNECFTEILVCLLTLSRRIIDIMVRRTASQCYRNGQHGKRC